MEKSYITLELPAVLEMLAAQAQSELGKEEAAALLPSPHPALLRLSRPPAAALS